MSFWRGMRSWMAGFTTMKEDRDYTLVAPGDLQATDAFGPVEEIVDYGMLRAHVETAWRFSRGKGITVVVLDTGICDHEELEVSARYDKTGLGLSGEDHATHIAGIIAARQNDVGVIGVAPEATIVSVRVLKSAGSGNVRHILEGLRLCEQIECDVINMSFGSSRKMSNEVHAAIKRLRAQGKYLVAAAGNRKGKVDFPAAYDEVIAVAAGGKDGGFAKFASRGPQIKVVAPGTDVYSTVCNDEYKVMSGSSMSAPFVSGTLALLLSYVRSGGDRFRIDSFEDMLSVLDSLCTVDPQASAKASKNMGYGTPNFDDFSPWKDTQ